jgi:hypothetical protein
LSHYFLCRLYFQQHRYFLFHQFHQECHCFRHHQFHQRFQASLRLQQAQGRNRLHHQCHYYQLCLLFQDYQQCPDYLLFLEYQLRLDYLLFQCFQLRPLFLRFLDYL